MNNPQDNGQMQYDGASWATTLLSRLGSAWNSLVNEFTMCIQFVSNPTKATQPYEKAALIIEGGQKDPSDYTNGVTKDAVGIHVGTTIVENNKTGRAWGGYFDAGCDKTSDGSFGAIEVGLRNNGTSQPLLGTPTTKTVLGIVAGEEPGNNPVTVGINMVGGTTKFHNGIIIESNAMVADSSTVVGILNPDGSYNFKLDTDGSVLLKQFKINPINSPELPKGQIAPGSSFIWGCTKTGITYHVYYNGKYYLGLPLTQLGED